MSEQPKQPRKIRFAVLDDAAESTLPTFQVDYADDARKLDVLRENPAVPIGALLTAAVLTGGLMAFKGGSNNMSQTMMRMRVFAQGGTLVALVPAIMRAQRGRTGSNATSTGLGAALK